MEASHSILPETSMRCVPLSPRRPINWLNRLEASIPRHADRQVEGAARGSQTGTVRLVVREIDRAIEQLELAQEIIEAAEAEGKPPAIARSPAAP